MAIYGFGAAFGGSEDMTADFINAGGAYVGYTRLEAPVAHAMLRQIEVGDLVFLKSFPPSIGLIVKAAGIVTDVTDRHDPDLGSGVGVEWIFRGELGGSSFQRIGKLRDKADHTRGGTLYREYNPGVQAEIIRLVLAR